MDDIPELDDFETYFHKLYWKLKKLSSSENYISILEYDKFLKYYPVPVDAYLFIDIIQQIDVKTTKFNRDHRSPKENAIEPKTPPARRR